MVVYLAPDDAGAQRLLKELEAAGRNGTGVVAEFLRGRGLLPSLQPALSQLGSME